MTRMEHAPRPADHAARTGGCDGDVQLPMDEEARLWALVYDSILAVVRACVRPCISACVCA